MTLDISFFGSSLVSAYWNGAATYYRGLIRCLAERGHRVTFYEPDAFERQAHRDMPDPDWATVVVYEASESAAQWAVRRAADSDVIVKASGVGIFDHLLEEAVLEMSTSSNRVVLWDVDAPATLAAMETDVEHPLRTLVPSYDMVLTYGGGEPVVSRYEALGAARCIPIYNALDPTTHHPVPKEARFESDLTFLGNRLPDREARVEEFFFRAVQASPERDFILGGSGWEGRIGGLANVRYLGHVSTRDHNALNSSALSVLNVSRESMASNGFSPATRVFEAAGAGACLITDAWEGIELFLAPGEEVLVAHDGEEVATLLSSLDAATAEDIGRAARRRLLEEHTYAHRAELVEEVLTSSVVVPGGA